MTTNPFEGFASQAWKAEALCAQVDPDRWFPDGPEHVEAIAVCARCPVKAACLDYALENNEQNGIWGGLTRPQLATLRRKRQRAATAAKRAAA